MSVLFPYSSDQSDNFSAQQKIKIGERTIEIEVATQSGQTQPDTPAKPNEDSLSVVQWGDSIVAAVFDGASSQKPIPEIEPVSGAAFASRSLKEIMEALPATQDMAAALKDLNRLLGERFQTFSSIDMTDVHTLPSSTATIVRISPNNDQLEVANVSDSFAIALLKDGRTIRLTDNKHRPFSEGPLTLLGQLAKKNNTTPREARNDPRIKEAIMEAMRNSRNRPDGTGAGIVNGDPDMDRYVYSFSLPLSEVDALLIGSDGLVPPNRDEAAEIDQKWLMQTAQREGVGGLITHTREIEDSDPDRHFLRYKHSDDATGILMRL